MKRLFQLSVTTVLLRIAAVLLSAALHACAVNPVTGTQDFVLMSESEEISLGHKYHQEIIKEMPVYPDQELAAYVNEVGQRVAKASHRPDLDYHFTVLDSTQVNAFALPGGYVYITRGLLAYLNSEAELAAVLGHEVGHVTARHSVRQHSAATAAGVAGAILQATTGVPGSQDLFNVLGNALLKGYGREHELESDRLGAQYLARTGYDPQAMLEVIGVLKNQEVFEQQRAREEGREPRVYHGVFASHPDNDTRLQEVVNEANTLKTTNGERTNREEFLTHLQGLAFGGSESDGMVLDNRFLHKPLDFGLTFPEHWLIENQPHRLLAVAPNQAALLQITVEPLATQVPQQRYLEQKGLRNLRNGKSLQIKGFQAYAASAPVKTTAGQRDARFVVIYDQQHAFLFTGVSKNSRQQALFDANFEQIAGSYHKLSQSEKKLATGQKLQLITADSATRFSELARQSPIRKHAESQLRLLNDLYPTGEPKAGQRVKIVR